MVLGLAGGWLTKDHRLLETIPGCVIPGWQREDVKREASKHQGWRRGEEATREANGIHTGTLFSCNLT